MASLKVDLDLDEFSLDEILDEVEDRYNYNSNKKEIDEWGKTFFGIEPPFRLSILDQMKIDLLMNNINKITLNDLEKLI
jgi:hypothetical protein